MPDLEGLAPVPVLGHFILKVTFHGTGVSNEPDKRAYIVSFIRILDKAICEYDQSRRELLAYISSSNRTLLLMKAVSHLETCVNSLRRCLRFFDRMKDLQLGNSNDQRLRRKWMKAKKSVVGDVRNAIEHMDEHIAKGEVAEGQPITLMISELGDRASIEGQEILLSDLANIIRELHAFAVQLCNYGDPAVTP